MNDKNAGSQPPHNIEESHTQNNTAQIKASEATVNQEKVIATVQRQKARRLLTLLQWAAFMVLLIGLIWLYIMQQRQYTELMQRLQSNAQLTDRINVLEDKLVASSQTANTTKNGSAKKTDDVSNQSQAQLEQARLQIQAANILSNNGQIAEAIQLLKGLRWQLQQDNNDIASALTLVINKSLDKDIAMLENISSQPDGWQNQALTIQAVQQFLYAAVNNNLKDNVKSRAKNSVNSNVNSNVKNQEELNNSGEMTASTASLQKAVISPRDAIVYDALMQLNLAQQAANDKDATMLKLYLTQAVERLNLIDRSTQRAEATINNGSNTPSHDISQDKKNTPAQQNSNLAQSTSNNNTGDTQQHSNTQQRSTAHQVHTLKTIADASKLLRQLAQHPPKPIKLTSMQVVSAPEVASTP